jgi:hypothetical protein
VVRARMNRPPQPSPPDFFFGVACVMRYPEGGGPTAKQRAQREQVRLRAAEMFTQGLAPLVTKALRVSRKAAYAWHPSGGTGVSRRFVPRGLPADRPA